MNLFIKKTGTTGTTVSLAGMLEGDTVDALFQRVDKDIGPDGNYGLIYGTKDLEGSRKKTLQECGIGNKSTLVLFYRVVGGRNPEQAAELEAAMLQQKTGLQPLAGWVTLSHDNCMITADDPDNGCNHAKLKCGHVISPQGMTGHALSLVQEGRYQFNCPLCAADWPFFVVKHVGCFTDDEKKQVETKLAENYAEKAMGIQKCPGCDSYCQRTDKNNKRVVCAVCTKKNGNNYEFCWSCLHEWEGSSSCGNSACDGKDTRNRYLRQCEEVEIQFSKVKCPSVRACPNPECSVLINHAKGCKQMQCTQCKTEFCFICLKKKENGKWKCGDSFTPCEKAPIQSF